MKRSPRDFLSLRNDGESYPSIGLLLEESAVASLPSVRSFCKPGLTKNPDDLL